MVNKKHAFWQALLSATLIFGAGLLLGTFLEISRANEVESLLLSSEINTLDSQLIGTVTDNFELECGLARERLFQSADDIFEEAIKLEKYDESSQLTTRLNSIHKKYDLLRLIIWTESIKLKKQCRYEFNTVVYLYQYNEPSIQTKSKQTVFSRYLKDLKEEFGSNILLIPIAADLNLESINLVKKKYEIDILPAIILNEDKTYHNIEELENLKEEIIYNQIEKIILSPRN